ncbi:hypothetical protein JCM10212_002104 [Sporobolomyces blumeae]
MGSINNPDSSRPSAMEPPRPGPATRELRRPTRVPLQGSNPGHAGTLDGPQAARKASGRTALSGMAGMSRDVEQESIDGTVKRPRRIVSAGAAAAAGAQAGGSLRPPSANAALPRPDSTSSGPASASANPSTPLRRSHLSTSQSSTAISRNATTLESPATRVRTRNLASRALTSSLALSTSSNAKPEKEPEKEPGTARPTRRILGESSNKDMRTNLLRNRTTVSPEENRAERLARRSSTTASPSSRNSPRRSSSASSSDSTPNATTRRAAPSAGRLSSSSVSANSPLRTSTRASHSSQVPPPPTGMRPPMTSRLAPSQRRLGSAATSASASSGPGGSAIPVSTISSSRTLGASLSRSRAGIAGGERTEQRAPSNGLGRASLGGSSIRRAAGPGSSAGGASAKLGLGPPPGTAAAGHAARRASTRSTPLRESSSRLEGKGKERERDGITDLGDSLRSASRNSSRRGSWETVGSNSAATPMSAATAEVASGTPTAAPSTRTAHIDSPDTFATPRKLDEPSLFDLTPSVNPARPTFDYVSPPPLGELLGSSATSTTSSLTVPSSQASRAPTSLPQPRQLSLLLKSSQPRHRTRGRESTSLEELLRSGLSSHRPGGGGATDDDLLLVDEGTSRIMMEEIEAFGRTSTNSTGSVGEARAGGFSPWRGRVVSLSTSLRRGKTGGDVSFEADRSVDVSRGTVEGGGGGEGAVEHDDDEMEDREVLVLQPTSDEAIQLRREKEQLESELERVRAEARDAQARAIDDLKIELEAVRNEALERQRAWDEDRRRHQATANQGALLASSRGPGPAASVDASCHLDLVRRIHAHATTRASYEVLESRATRDRDELGSALDALKVIGQSLEMWKANLVVSVGEDVDRQ